MLDGFCVEVLNSTAVTTVASSVIFFASFQLYIFITTSSIGTVIVSRRCVLSAETGIGDGCLKSGPDENCYLNCMTSKHIEFTLKMCFLAYIKKLKAKCLLIKASCVDAF